MKSLIVKLEEFTLLRVGHPLRVIFKLVHAGFDLRPGILQISQLGVHFLHDTLFLVARGHIVH